jgi:hypothetical protein
MDGDKNLNAIHAQLAIIRRQNFSSSRTAVEDEAPGVALSSG